MTATGEDDLVQEERTDDEEVEKIPGPQNIFPPTGKFGKIAKKGKKPNVIHFLKLLCSNS